MLIAAQFLAITLLLVLAHGAQALSLAGNGVPAVAIAVADQPAPAELTAAQELATYLGKITGGRFLVHSESTLPPGSAGIYVGPTRAALKAGVDCSRLGPEEWTMRTSGPDVILAGGRPRGTLYAVDHFLEEVLDVHWWNPWEESVPRSPSLTVGPLDLHGTPVFPYRDIFMLYGNDAGRFAARNRLNRDGDAAIDARYGGSMAYGPPYHVHTFSLYFPPQEYFNQHPEWFSLINGTRSGDATQLCLTNPELRRAFLAKLIANIDSSRVRAKAANLPPPLIFSVSQNDNQHPCQCDKCQAIARVEGSEAGPLLDFVNFLADGIRSRYPDVMIDTLAYQYTQKPPRTIRPRDNVVVRLCNSETDLIRPVTDPANVEFRDLLVAWARITRNLRVWDYAVTYTPPVGMPLPTSATYQPTYQFYAANNVKGVFTEHEYPILADMRDFKVWLMMKLLENPYADATKLENTFLDGFYGPAAPMIRQYLGDLAREARDRGTRAGATVSASQLGYLNAGFVVRAQALFDRAEQAVSTNTLLQRRVRHARLPLDRASVVLFTKLQSEWGAIGGDKSTFPLDREKTARRALQTWYEQADMRMAGGERSAEKLREEAELKHYVPGSDSEALPAKFRDLPRGAVFDYTANATRNWLNVVRVVPDRDAESGITNCLDLTGTNVDHAERYVLPMTWGLYDTVTRKGEEGTPIKAEDIPGPGYHWYKMGTFAIGPSRYLYFFWSWIIQLDVGDLFDFGKPDQKYDVWARIKFTGPRFPHAQAGDRDAIYVERIVLVKAS